MVNSPDVALLNAAYQSGHGPKFGANQCQMQCHLLYGIPTDGTPTAAAWWAKSAYKHPTTDPSTAPRGAFHYFTGGSSGAGHVMISTGGSASYSTDIKRTGYFDVTTVEEVLASWTALRYVGWTEDIDGVRVINAGGDPVAARIDGIDLSHWQGGSLDFNAAKKAGVRWVYHKVSEGTGGLDANYATRRGQVAKAGLRFGGYHFARPASSSGVSQARVFLAVAKPKAGDMRPMLDLEDNGGKSRADLTAWVKSFVTEIVKQTGAPPWIYTHFPLDDNFDCPLWVARYSNGMSQPVVPAPWKQYTIWQFSDGVYGHPNTVPGIGACDINTMNGDPAALTDAFTIGKTPPPPPTKDWFDMATQADLEAAIVKHIPDIAAAILSATVTNRNPDGTSAPMQLGELLSQVEVAEDRLGARLRDMQTVLTNAEALLEKLPGA